MRIATLAFLATSLFLPLSLAACDDKKTGSEVEAKADDSKARSSEAGKGNQPAAVKPAGDPKPATAPPPAAPVAAASGDACGALPAFRPAQRTLRLNRFIGTCAQVKEQVEFSQNELKQLFAGKAGAEAWLQKLYTHEFDAGTAMCGLEMRGVDPGAAQQLITWLRCKAPRACPRRFCRLTKF